MNSQTLRLGIAGLLALASIIGVCVLSILQVAIPEALSVTTIASTAYLFGVTTNGSGIPKSKTNGDAK